MKRWIVANPNSFNGLGLKRAVNRPDDAIAEYPQGMHGKFIDVVEVLYEKRFDPETGAFTARSETVQINPHLLRKKLEMMGQMPLVEHTDKDLIEKADELVVVPDTFDELLGHVPHYKMKELDQIPLMPNAEAVVSWNEQSPWTRLKSAFISGK